MGAASAQVPAHPVPDLRRDHRRVLGQVRGHRRVLGQVRGHHARALLGHPSHRYGGDD
ncbi:MAG: hypothetical protein ACLPKE_32380 [Streptosporangiaceae bacterium]